MARPGGLGKGLGALIPTGVGEAVPTADGLQEVPVAQVRPNRFQPRDVFDEESLAELAESIREVGVLQPILVRPVDDGFELIAGERRWRAARRVGLQTIPALVRSADDLASLQQALVENVQRASLNPLEEAAAYQQLIEDFGLTHDDVGNRVGKSRATVSNTLRLLQLPPTIQRYLQTGQMREGHARALLGTPDRAFQEQLAKRAVQEGLSVRAVEEAVRARSDTPAARAAAAATAGGAKTALRPPGLLELEELLSDYLDTRVQVTLTDKRGKVAIDFATLEDLERIYRIITEGRRATQAGPPPPA